VVLSLYYQDLAAREIAAHFEDICRTEVFKGAINRMAAKVIEEMQV
jgi:transposase-like protein